MQGRLRKVRRRDGFLPNNNLDLARASSSLCFDLRLATPKQDQQAPLSTRIFQSDSQEVFDQCGKGYLARNRLRRFHDGLDVQLSDWRINRARRGGSSSFAQPRVPFVELLDLSVGAPAVITVPRIPEIGVGECLEAARRIKPRRDLIGERLIVDKAVRTRRADGLFVELNGIESSTFDTRNLRVHQCGAVFEIFRAKFRTYRQLFVVSSEGIQMLLALARIRNIATRRTGKRAVKFVFCELKTRRCQK